MKKAQATKFWRALQDSTSVGDVITSFQNKPGYAGERTLERYGQAHKGFSEGLSPGELAIKTGWGVPFIEKIYGWWCKEFPQPVSLPTSSRGEAAERATGDVVYQRAWLNHIRKLSELTKRLGEQLYLPPPHEAGSWVPPRPTRSGAHRLWSGDGSFEIRGWVWQPGRGVSGKLQLAVQREMYFSRLRNHIAVNEIWKELEKWKRDGAAYLHGCGQLFNDIVCECQQPTKVATTLSEQGFPQQGISWRFPRQVYSNATLKAQGHAGLGSPPYEYRAVPEKGKARRRIWVLWAGSEAVAAHRNRRVLSQWRTVHEALLTSDLFEASAKKLVGQHRALEQRARSIKEALRLEVERGTLDQGSCDLCPRRPATGR